MEDQVSADVMKSVSQQVVRMKRARHERELVVLMKEKGYHRKSLEAVIKQRGAPKAQSGTSKAGTQQSGKQTAGQPKLKMTTYTLPLSIAAKNCRLDGNPAETAGTHNQADCKDIQILDNSRRKGANQGRDLESTNNMS